jgi:ribosomal protein S18 acetylase RimI-like enzyme
MTSFPYIPKKPDAAKAARVLAEAFFNYPTYVYSIPNAKKRLSALQTLFEIEFAYTRKYGRIYATSENVEGIMYCLSKKEPHISDWRMIKCGALKVPFKVGVNFIKRENKFVSAQEELHAKYATFPHTYLWSIGVRPQEQSKKYASKLIQYLLHDLAERHEACYLETASEVNVGIYEHLGFQLMGENELPELKITTWSMLWKNSEQSA